MNDNQLAEIRNYLLDKKLPIDILLEVQDHFVSQINDLEREEDLTFEEAFEKTKKSWQSELKPYWNGSWDLTDRSKLIREINRANFWSLCKKSIPVSIITILILMILSKVIDVQVFKYAFVIIVGLFFIAPIVNYFLRLNDFRLVKKYNQVVLISIQEYTLLSVGGIYFYFKFFTEGFLVAEQFSQFFTVGGSKPFVIGVLFTMILLFASSLTYFSQKIYLEKIYKVKPFLKYL